ncbi:MAG: hypothetical protein IJB96_07620 [Lachnospira sp.]|nr:hypothetical protein [Lachnospira sp.]
MKALFKWGHKGVNAAVMGMFVLSMIYMFVKWNDIPDWAGVHFDLSTREFDVYASKWFCLYPHIVNAIVLAVFGIVGRLITTVKVGMKINAIGEEKLKTFFNMTMDVLKLSIVGYFSHWSWCVTRQERFSEIVMELSSYGLCVGFVLMIMGTIIIRVVYSNKKVI